MSKSRLKEAATILTGFGAAEVYLFGSYADGRARADSDVDLAVTALPPELYFEALGALLEKLGRHVDIVNLDRNTPIARRLRERGELVRLG